MTDELPVIDIGSLVSETGDIEAVSARLDEAARRHGFFMVTGHGVDPSLETALDHAARGFFAQPDEVKAEVAMGRFGASWRGWFPVGGELTSGVPDHKEGLYLGEHLDSSDARVRAGLALHGPNPRPAHPAELADLVEAWMIEMRRVAESVLRGLAISLGLAPEVFASTVTATPTMLLRLFHYPPAPSHHGWGVAEHTDYGLLTVLRQDTTGGLEVHAPDGWIEAPPTPGAFVCNLGDMLERMTGGRYRSTPHRVRPTPTDAAAPDGVGRISIPFFFDPSWDVHVEPLPVGDPLPEATARWDGEDPLAFDGSYGDYLTSRVARVFPDLFDSIAAPGQGLRAPINPTRP